MSIHNVGHLTSFNHAVVPALVHTMKETTLLTDRLDGYAQIITLPSCCVMPSQGMQYTIVCTVYSAHKPVLRCEILMLIVLMGVEHMVEGKQRNLFINMVSSVSIHYS